MTQVQTIVLNFRTARYAFSPLEGGNQDYKKVLVVKNFRTSANYKHSQHFAQLGHKNLIFLAFVAYLFVFLFIVRII